MNSWSPLWSDVVDSSLWEEEPFVRVLFMTMIALKDSDHIVRFDGYKLHKKAHLTPEQTVQALKVLSSPDTRRPKAFEQKFQGRRIQQVEEGWLILNGQEYRDKMQKMKVRAYKTQWERDKRADEKQVVLVGKEAEAYEESRGKHWTKRRKVVKDAGAVNGATAALAAGLEDAKNSTLGNGAGE